MVFKLRITIVLHTNGFWVLLPFQTEHSMG